MERSIDNRIHDWCLSQEGVEVHKDEGCTRYVFSFLDLTANVHRFEGRSLVSSGIALAGDDVDFYEHVGDAAWKQLVMRTNTALDRTDIQFSEVPAYEDPDMTVPAYNVTDSVLDDGFSLDVLYRTVRGVITATWHIQFVLKAAKRSLFKPTEGI